MKKDEIEPIVERAAQRLVNEQADLFILGVGELTIAEQLAAYIREAIPEHLRVDVEYNRHGKAYKVLMLPPKDNPDQPRIAKVVRPDIIVHQRGHDMSNIAAFEVKKPGAELSHDRAKLKALKEQFGYMHAAHIIAGATTGDPTCEVIWIDD